MIYIDEYSFVIVFPVKEYNIKFDNYIIEHYYNNNKTNMISLYFDCSGYEYARLRYFASLLNVKLLFLNIYRMNIIIKNLLIH